MAENRFAQYAEGAGNRFARFAETATKPRVGVMEDVGRSVVSGLERAAQSFAGAKGDAIDLTSNAAIDAAVRSGLIDRQQAAKARKLVTGVRQNRIQIPVVTNVLGSAPTSAELRAGSLAAYEPQTVPGRIGKAVGENAPNALAPGGVATRAANVLLPAVAGEGAAMAAQSMGAGERGQAVARVGGSIVGGLAASVRPGAARPPEAANALNPLSRTAPQNPNALRAEAQRYRDAGLDPTLADVVDESGRGVMRAAASRMSPGRQAAQDFAEGRALDLPDRLTMQAQRIGPSVDVPGTRARIASEIADASTPPPAAIGSSGRQVSERLNSAFDQARGATDEAYNAARAASPEQAMIPRARQPEIAANIREAVRDFDPRNVPRVARELSTLDNKSTSTARDLFELRSRLSALSASADPVEASAAGRAVRALDREIDGIADVVSGDPAVIGLWRSAIQLRRQQGQTFQSGDLIEDLTARVRRGGGMANAVSPEDASAAIFGRTGVQNRGNSVRDLRRLRDMLGPESREWQAVQDEAIARILTADAGRTDFGRSLQRFASQSPDLAELLISPRQRQAVQQAQARISAAVSRGQALDLGERFVAPGPADEFSAALGGMTPEQRALAAGAARRAVETEAGRSVASAPGVARRLATAPQQRQRNEALMGPDRARQFEQAVGLEERAVRNANDIAPRFGSQTQPRGQDAEAVEGAMRIGGQLWRRDFVGIATDWLRSRGMNDQQAQLLIEAVTDPTRLDDAIAYLERAYGPQEARQFLQLRNAATVGAISVGAQGSQAQAAQDPRQGQ